MSPGARTLQDVEVVTYSRDPFDIEMRRVAAWTQQQSNPSQYYLDAETAADTGIEYWNNKPLITALIENEIIMKLPQATGLNQGIIDSVLRPSDIDEKKRRVDAYVRELKGES